MNLPKPDFLKKINVLQKMKTKKGFLLAEETLKIIIAVICIGFLVYFLVSLYNSNKDSKKFEEAETSLDFLIEEIKGSRKEVQIYNPIQDFNAWEIISWPNSIKEGMPNSCSNIGWENCLCICPRVNVNNCDGKGVCRESEFSVEGGSIKIKKPPVILEIDYENKIIRRIEG